MSVTASVTSITDSLRLQTLIGDRHWIATDEPETLGGADSAPTPYELLAGALAACVATTLRMYARRKGWELEDVTVDVELDGNARPPQATIALRLPEELEPERRDRLEQVAQACAVHRTLERGVVFEHAAPAAV